MRVGGRAEVAIKIDAAQPPLQSAHFL